MQREQWIELEEMIARTNVPELSVRRYIDAITEELDEILLVRGKKYSTALVDLLITMERLEGQGLGLDFIVKCVRNSIEEQIKGTATINPGKEKVLHLQIIQETLEAIGRSFKSFLPVIAQVERLTEEMGTLSEKIIFLEKCIQAMQLELKKEQRGISQ